MKKRKAEKNALKWFTIQLAPDWERPSELEWRATEGKIDPSDKRLSGKAEFTTQVLCADREEAILQARRQHGYQTLLKRIEGDRT